MLASPGIPNGGTQQRMVPGALTLALDKPPYPHNVPLVTPTTAAGSAVSTSTGSRLCPSLGEQHFPPLSRACRVPCSLLPEPIPSADPAQPPAESPRTCREGLAGG